MEDGSITPKHLMIQGFRTAALVDRPGADGAQWLAKLGLPVGQIQLLGRWSSAAVERYIQTAPLRLGDDTTRLLNQAHRSSAVLRQEDLQPCTTGGAFPAASTTVVEPPEIGTDSELPGEQASASQANEIQDLRAQVASLRQVMSEPVRVLVHR